MSPSLVLAIAAVVCVTRCCHGCTSQEELSQLFNTDEILSQGCQYPNNIVECHPDGNYITITPCYCMSNNTVGYCYYTCFSQGFFVARNNSNDLEKQCHKFKRSGRFCANCKNGYGFPAYSFSLKCVKCEASWKNIATYIAVAYGPLTLFLILIVVLRVSVNSAPLHGFIFVAQISSTAFQMRLADGMVEFDHLNKFQHIGIIACGTVYGIWNLDFLRAVYHPFCIHPKMSTVHVMSLDYIIASYPCVIILFTYTMAEFHARGYRLFIILWKPFHCCFARFRHQLSIKTTMADAFGTFFSLSYAKSLSTTIDLFAMTHIWDSKGHKKGLFVYYDANNAVLSEEHIRLLLVALFFFLIFNVLPIFVLFIYSFKKQSLIVLVPMEERGFFRPLINTLLGSYKDGSDGGWNCRFFAVAYLIARIIMFVGLVLTLNYFFQLLATVILIITGMLVAVIKPYKSTIYNTTDTILLLFLALAYMGVASYFFAYYISPMSLDLAKYLPGIPFIFPFLYITGLISYNTCVVNKLPQRAIMRVHLWAVHLTQSLLELPRRCAARYRSSVEIKVPSSTLVAIESDSVTVQTVHL